MYAFSAYNVADITLREYASQVTMLQTEFTRY